jgi:hypothetical protein
MKVLETLSDVIIYFRPGGQLLEKTKNGFIFQDDLDPAPKHVVVGDLPPTQKILTYPPGSIFVSQNSRAGNKQTSNYIFFTYQELQFNILRMEMVPFCATLQDLRGEQRNVYNQFLAQHDLSKFPLLPRKDIIARLKGAYKPGTPLLFQFKRTHGIEYRIVVTY